MQAKNSDESTGCSKHISCTLKRITQINNKVFGTYLKSDKQHEVAGQKTNHGG